MPLANSGCTSAWPLSNLTKKPYTAGMEGAQRSGAEQRVKIFGRGHSRKKAGSRDPRSHDFSGKIRKNTEKSEKYSENLEKYVKFGQFSGKFGKILQKIRKNNLENQVKITFSNYGCQWLVTNTKLLMKYIGVLRDTARAPKPTTQYNTIQYHAIPFIR